MDFNFKNLSLGEKLILISCCIAIISLFMPWANLFGLSQNGFEQQGYIVLIAFLYPVIAILMGKHIYKIIGIISGGIGIIIMIFYISSKQADIFGTSINATGTGAYLSIIATILLAIGCLICTAPRKE
jgi:hypothetical protein